MLRVELWKTSHMVRAIGLFSPLPLPSLHFDPDGFGHLLHGGLHEFAKGIIAHEIAHMWWWFCDRERFIAGCARRPGLAQLQEQDADELAESWGYPQMRKHVKRAPDHWVHAAAAAKLRTD